jgi:hypothetical protein
MRARGAAADYRRRLGSAVGVSFPTRHFFYLKDLLKEHHCFRPMRAGMRGADVLELLKPHFLRFIGNPPKCGTPKDLDSAAYCD